MTHDMAGAVAAVREAMAIQRRRPGGTDRDLVRSLRMLGSIRFLQQNDPAGAEAARTEAAAVARRAYGDDPPGDANMDGFLGHVARERGDLARAEALYRLGRREQP